MHPRSAAAAWSAAEFSPFSGSFLPSSQHSWRQSCKESTNLPNCHDKELGLARQSQQPHHTPILPSLVFHREIWGHVLFALTQQDHLSLSKTLLLFLGEFCSFSPQMEVNPIGNRSSGSTFARFPDCISLKTLLEMECLPHSVCTLIKYHCFFK